MITKQDLLFELSLDDIQQILFPKRYVLLCKEIRWAKKNRIDDYLNNLLMTKEDADLCLDEEYFNMAYKVFTKSIIADVQKLKPE